MTTAATRTVSPNRAGLRPTAVVFWALLALGFALRIVFSLTAAHSLDSDHAVVYLMAKHALEGELTPFFWGQSYGGTILSLSTAAVMAVVGTAPIVLPVVAVIWMAAAAVLLRVIVGRGVNPAAGDAAGVAFWFPTYVLLYGSTRDPGFYAPSLAIGLGVVAIAVVAARPVRLVWWIGAGLLCGLALWTSPMALALAAPGAVGLLLRGGIAPLKWLIAASAAVVGGSPWLIAAVTAPVTKPIGTASGIHWNSFVTIFTELLPAAFPMNAYPQVRIAVAVAAVAAITGLLLLGGVRRRPAMLMLAIGTVLVVAVLVYGSGVELQRDSMRYAIFLLPALAAALGWLVSRVRALVWAVLLVAPTVTIAMVADETDGFRWESSRFDPSLIAVERVLGEQDLHHVYASYWISYALSAASEEEITAAPLVVRRYEPYEVLAAESRPLGFVVNADQGNDQMLAELAEQYGGSRTQVEGYAVWVFSTPFDVYAQPWQIV